MQDKSEFNQYSSRLSQILASIQSNEIESILKLIQETITTEGTIYIIGNGGSASTASHFSNDLNVGLRKKHKYPKSIALTDNISILTAIANDISYAEVFRFQLEGILQENDLVIALSVSGESENVINAVKYANERKTKTVSIVGFTGGRLLKVSFAACHVQTNLGEYGPAEDCMLAICHYLASRV